MHIPGLSLADLYGNDPLIFYSFDLFSYSVYFKDIIGHTATKALLIRMAQQGHVGHALMFLGSNGSGNLPLAIAFAGYVFCENPGNDDRCGNCASCKKMNQLGHPDLHFSFPIVKQKDGDTSKQYVKDFMALVNKHPYLSLKDWEVEHSGENKKSLIPADESTNIVKSLSLKSFSGGHKVLIVWHAERMNIQAANRLLKTLEEPSEKTIVILVVPSAEELLTTIVSRTQLINCGNVKDEEIEQWLVEREDIDPVTAQKVARLADGNFNMALKLAHVEATDETNYFGLFVEWMRACAAKDIFKAQLVAEKLASFKRDHQQYFLDYCLQFFHKSVLQAHIGEEASRFDDEALPFAKKFAPHIAKAELVRFHDIFSNGHYMVSRNVNSSLLFMQMSYDLIGVFRAIPK